MRRDSSQRQLELLDFIAIDQLKRLIDAPFDLLFITFTLRLFLPVSMIVLLSITLNTIAFIVE